MNLEQLLKLAEDELVIYSSDAFKIEKLRRRLGLTLNLRQQESIKQELLTQMPTAFWAKWIENNRQMFALPFWGVAGLGLLLGISFRQPLDFIGPALGFPIAIKIQLYGWKLMAKRLLLNTLEAMEEARNNPKPASQE